VYSIVYDLISHEYPNELTKFYVKDDKSPIDLGTAKNIFYVYSNNTKIKYDKERIKKAVDLLSKITPNRGIKDLDWEVFLPLHIMNTLMKSELVKLKTECEGADYLKHFDYQRKPIHWGWWVPAGIPGILYAICYGTRNFARGAWSAESLYHNYDCFITNTLGPLISQISKNMSCQEEVINSLMKIKKNLGEIQNKMYAELEVRKVANKKIHEAAQKKQLPLKQKIKDLKEVVADETVGTNDKKKALNKLEKKLAKEIYEEEKAILASSNSPLDEKKIEYLQVLYEELTRKSDLIVGNNIE